MVEPAVVSSLSVVWTIPSVVISSSIVIIFVIEFVIGTVTLVWFSAKDVILWKSPKQKFEKNRERVAFVFPLRDMWVLCTAEENH